MSPRKKLIVSLSVLVLTVMVGIVSVVGVLSLLRADFNFGGSISFTATNVHATVSAASVENGTINNAPKMQSIIYDANNDLNGENEDTWSGLDLTFNEDGDDVVIKFTVTNHSTSDKLRLTLGKPTGEAINATISVALTEGRDGVSTIVMGDDEVYTTAVINAAVTGEPNTEYSAEVVITFHITNKNNDASIANFNIPIKLEKFDGYLTYVTFAEDFVYTLDGTVKEYMDSISVKTDLQAEYTNISNDGQILKLKNGSTLYFNNNSKGEVKIKDYYDQTIEFGTVVGTSEEITETVIVKDNMYYITSIDDGQHAGGHN